MTTDQDWIRSDGKGGVRIGDADPIPAFEIDAFVALVYRVAGMDPFFVLPFQPDSCRHADHGVTVQPSPDNRPGNVPGVFLRTRADTTRLMCGEARHIAWHLMLHAEQAEAASEVKPETDPADAARITSFFADATEEEIAGFLARFEITERPS